MNRGNRNKNHAASRAGKARRLLTAALCAGLAAVLLCGCGPVDLIMGLLGGGASSSSSALPSYETQPDASAPSLPVSAPVSSSAPASSSVAAAADVDKQDFLDFLNIAGIGVFLGMPYAEGDDIQAWDYFTAMGPVGWFLEEYYHEHGLDTGEVDGDGFSYFPEDVMRQASKEFYGVEYAVRPGQVDTTYIPAGNYPKVWGFGPGYWGEADASTFQVAGDNISVEMLYESNNGRRWTMRHTFRYLPQNQYCPYQLIRSEELSRSDMIEPDTQITGNASYVTTAELNLRYGPGKEYDSMLLIPAGQEIYLYGRMAAGPDDWVCVEYGMMLGWVNTGYITPA